MDRRRFLGLVGGIGGVLAGCLGQGSTPERSTDSPTPSPTVKPEVEPPACPEKPESFTRDTVLEYAIKFERAYISRQTLRQPEHILHIDIDISEEQTNRSDDGWVARFTVQRGYTYIPSGNRTDTQHVDPEMYGVNYFITAETVVRATGFDGVAPREEGTVVQCPPD